MSDSPSTAPPICDYEGSGYQADFWQGKGRDYEDVVERIALRKLLPSTGKRCAEFGAGFGRLSYELARFDQVVVVDYSRSLLRQAQARLGNDPRFIYIAADVNMLPFAANAFDTATLIRVIHHSAAPLTTTLRAGLLKRRLPLRLLTAIDRLIQPSGAFWPISPSVFVRCTADSKAVNNMAQPPSQPAVVPFEKLFVNPQKRDSILQREGDWLVCPQTGTRWPIRDGLYDFKGD